MTYGFTSQFHFTFDSDRKKGLWVRHTEELYCYCYANPGLSVFRKLPRIGATHCGWFESLGLCNVSQIDLLHVQVHATAAEDRERYTSRAVPCQGK